MSQEPAREPAKQPPAPVSEPPPAPAPPQPGKGARVGAIVVLVLIIVSLLWYFVADRLTPYTSQARIQAFVVPVAAEVPGLVLKVYVKNNDEVQKGQPLFDIDPTLVPHRRGKKPLGLRDGSALDQWRELDGGGGQGRGAGGRGHRGLRPPGCDASRTDLQGRSRRDLPASGPECTGHPPQGRQPA